MKTTDLRKIGMMASAQFSESQYRQGRGKCDTCHGKGVLDEGAENISWKSNRVLRNRKTGEIRVAKRLISRPSIHGETCPKCFGMRFGKSVVDRAEARQTGGGFASNEDLAESLMNQTANPEIHAPITSRERMQAQQQNQQAQQQSNPAMSFIQKSLQAQGEVALDQSAQQEVDLMPDWLKKKVRPENNLRTFGTFDLSGGFQGTGQDHARPVQRTSGGMGVRQESDGYTRFSFA